MGFLGKLIGSVVDVALTPIDIVTDIANGAIPLVDDDTETEKTIRRNLDNLKDAGDDALDGDLL